VLFVRERSFKNTRTYKRLKEKKEYTSVYIYTKFATSIIYALLNIYKRFNTLVLLLYKEYLEFIYIFCYLRVNLLLFTRRLSIYREFSIVKLLLYIRNFIASCATSIVYTLLSARKRFKILIIYKAITIF